jgi:hypothetical protein
VIEFLQANWSSVAVLAAAFVLFLLLRNRATRISGLAGTVGQGEPVIVEVFSNT